MSYESPITMYTERIAKDIVEKQDAYLMECVRKVGFDINKDELAKALAYDRDQYNKGYHDGRMYQPPVKTNYDRLQAMSVEELAEYMDELRIYGGCPNHGAMNCREKCSDCWLEWLKQEAQCTSE